MDFTWTCLCRDRETVCAGIACHDGLPSKYDLFVSLGCVAQVGIVTSVRIQGGAGAESVINRLHCARVCTVSAQLGGVNTHLQV